jgi:hypothetical protein
MKNRATIGAYCIMIFALCANSAFGQLSLDSASPDEAFDVLVTEGTTQEFTIVVSGAATPTYTWTVNNIVQDRPNSPTFTLAPDFDFVQDRFSGDRFGLYCTITADGGSVIASWIVVVQDVNRAPSVGTMLLQESPQGRASRFVGLQVYVREGSPTDPDPGELLSYTFTWENGEDTVVDGPRSENSSTLDSASYIDEGDVWTCTLRVEDQFGAISADSITSASFQVNNLPVTGTPTLYYDFPFSIADPFNGVSPTIGGGPENITDVDIEDQGSLQYRYQWYVDESPIALGDFDDLPLDTAAYPGATVYLEVIPRDDYDEGIPARSGSVVIGHLFEVTYDNPSLLSEAVQFGFHEEAAVGEDSFDYQGGASISLLDSTDAFNSNFYSRIVVPPNDDQIFTLYVYDNSGDGTLSWPDNFFPLGNTVMYQIAAGGRIIDDRLWDLNQAGSLSLPGGEGDKLFQVRHTNFGRQLELTKLRPGWNLLSPPKLLEPASIAAATGVGGAQYGFSWNTDLGLLETTEEFSLLEGCWLHNAFSNGVLQSFGTVSNPAVLSLKPGWNLVGVTRQIDAPSGPNYRSPWWGWSGSFRSVSELVPGEAYWINVIEAVDIPLTPAP